MDELIREACQDDLIVVAQLFRFSRESELPYLPNLHTPEEDLNFFQNVVFATQKIFVLLNPEQIVGFIAFDDEWVHHLYLHPQAVGKGFGEKLLKIAKASSQTLQLWAFQRNTRAIKFYEKHGFRIIQETDGAGNEEREPDVLMEWTHNIEGST